MRQVERVGVVAGLGRVPARARTARTRRPAIRTGYMFSTANAMPGCSLAQPAQAVAEGAGVVALPGERRVHHHGRRAELSASTAERRSRSHGSGLHTRWVTSRQGACTEPTGTP